MTILAHLASGYSIYKVVTNTSEIETSLFLGLSMIGALTPDIDGLFGRKLKDHRNTIFHAPLFWLCGFIATHSISYVVDNTNFSLLMNIFFVNIFIHLFLDWFGGRAAGIRIFYPFSKKVYALFPIKPGKADFPVFPPSKKHVEFYKKFYLENKFLMISELLIVFSPLIFLFFD